MSKFVRWLGRLSVGRKLSLIYLLDLSAVIDRAASSYDHHVQRQFAQVAVRDYDYKLVGLRLAQKINQLRSDWPR